MQYQSQSIEQTKEIAAAFAGSLAGGEVVALEGDLGAGKTAFVQGAAEALGVSEPVRSPTFTLMNHYRTDHDAIRELVHADLYRLERPVELLALGLEEWIGRGDTVMFVEWPRMLEDPADFVVRISGTGETREIEIKSAAS